MTDRFGRHARSSVRSRDSSISDTDPREKIKDCCRKLVAFMCTQVGVGGLIVGYTVIGAFGFKELEAQYTDPQHLNERVVVLRATSVRKIWDLIQKENIFNQTSLEWQLNEQLLDFQDEMVAIIKEGYDGKDITDMWSFPAALMFSLSIITMIGYGNLVPRTDWGKFLAVVYAVFGIPLYILYFLNMGEVLAGCFRWVYTRLYECSTRREAQKRVAVPTTACLWVIGGYVLTGTILFAEWENWSYLDSTYFCVTSLCKLGLGDFVPGAASKSGNQTKLVINFVYMLVGLGLVAMCYNLMREEVRIKIKELKEDINQCLEDTRIRFISCYQRCRGRDYYEY